MDKKPRSRFLDWFFGVFVYHYGKLAIFLSILAVIFIFTIIETVSTHVNYDFTMSIVVPNSIDYDALDRFEAFAAEVVGDLNGDGEVNVSVEVVSIELDSVTKLTVFIAQDDVVVYLMDDYYSKEFAGVAEFNDLRDYGFSPETDNPARIYIGDSPYVRDLNVNVGFYACLADWTTSGKGNPKWTEAGVRLINALLTS